MTEPRRSDILHARIGSDLVELVRTEADRSGCTTDEWVTIAIRQLAARERRQRQQDQQSDDVREPSWSGEIGGVE